MKSRTITVCDVENASVSDQPNITTDSHDGNTSTTPQHNTTLILDIGTEGKSSTTTVCDLENASIYHQPNITTDSHDDNTSTTTQHNTTLTQHSNMEEFNSYILNSDDDFDCQNSDNTPTPILSSTPVSEKSSCNSSVSTLIQSPCSLSTISSASSATSKMVSKSVKRDVPPFIYVKTENPKRQCTSRSEQQKPPKSEKLPSLAFLELRVDGFLSKVEHSIQWACKCIREGDTESAIAELKQLESVRQLSRSSIHQAVARLRHVIQNNSSLSDKRH